jgi:hypothetical protein
MSTFGEVGRGYGTLYRHAQEACGAIRQLGDRLPLLISISRHASRPPGVVSRHARRRLWLRSHGSWVGTPLPTSWRAPEAAAQEIEARAPEQLAREHLEAMVMPLHRARTPGACHARVDLRIVLAEPLGQASPGRHRTGGGARQPGIAARRRPLAQKNFRTLSCTTTRSWAHGRSAAARV